MFGLIDLFDFIGFIYYATIECIYGYEDIPNEKLTITSKNKKQ